MNTIRNKLWPKILTAILFPILVAVALGGIGALFMLYDYGYGPGNTASFQDTSAYRAQCQRYAAYVRTLRLEREIDQDSLSYVDRIALEQDIADLEGTLQGESTNFRYQILSYDGSTVLEDNLLPGEDFDQLVFYPTYYTVVNGSVEGRYTMGQSVSNLYQDDNGAWYYLAGSYDTGTSYEVADADDPELSGEGAASSADPQTYVLKCGPKGDLTVVKDGFGQAYTKYIRLSGLFWPVLAATCAAGVLALVCLVWLLWAAGHKKGVEGIHLARFDRFWFAGVVALLLLAAGLIAAILDQWSYVIYHGYDWEVVVFVAVAAGLYAALTLPLLCTFTVRCKAHSFWKTTMLYALFHRLGGLLGRVAHACLELGRALPLIWKAVLGFCAYLALSSLLYFLFCVFLVNWAEILALFTAILFLLLQLAALAWFCYWCRGFARVRQGAAAIAAGDLRYQISTDRMPGDLRAHGEDLNNISSGMARAVEEQMKSERFKAELITNVSHDLKTPLTSIINYVDLLKKEPLDNPKAVEYVEVLDRKSQRLKKLTEDLVEASKASTGTLPLHRERLDMTQLLTQALGEYQEKLDGLGFQVVSKLPEEPLPVEADGRHIWRIVDNLLSNCCKYALPGTRVYVDLWEAEGKVNLSIKNISRDPLNIPAEQLMERFVRGDESRTTEGSGLGLSIARSLAELQGGMFRLDVDGDLFKAALVLPKAENA